MNAVDGPGADSFEPFNDGKYSVQPVPRWYFDTEKGIVNPECWRNCLIDEKNL